MYKDYQDAILKYYEEKKINKDLSLSLLQPTPSKLRDECSLVYRSRFLRKDQTTLMSFFEVDDSSKILKTIEGFDIDKFRPLANYMKKLTTDTEYKNVELLAWLLDFPRRPHDQKFDYQKGNILVSEKTLAEINPGGNVIDKTESFPGPFGAPASFQHVVEEQTQDKPQGFNKQRRRIIVGSLIAVLGLIAAFSNMVSGKKRCMMWVDDHYERVSCDSPDNTGLTLPIDESRLQLYKITMPDTLSEKHVGKVWYRKRGGDSLDLFTAGGRDPIDPNGNLHPLTIHIFDKYLRKKSLTDSSSIQ